MIMYDSQFIWFSFDDRWSQCKNMIYTLGFLYISSSGSANEQLSGCFRPWLFSMNIGLNMFSLDSAMSCLHSLLLLSTGEFQALQLIVLAAFGAVD